MQCLYFGETNSRYRIRQIGRLTPLVEDALVRVGLAAFGPLMCRQEVLEHIHDGKMHFAAVLGDEVVGFAFSKMVENALYMSGEAVMPEHQGNRLHTHLSLARLVSAESYEKVSVRTQNPRIEHSLRKALEMKGKGNFSVKRTRIDGMYGRRLSIQDYRCPSEELNRIYAELDAERGDAYFVEFCL